MKSYAHPVDGQSEWCYERIAKAKAETKDQPVHPPVDDAGNEVPFGEGEEEQGPTSDTSTTQEPPEPKSSRITKAQANRITELMGQTGYTADVIKAHVLEKYKKETSSALTKEEVAELIKDIGDFKI